MANRALIEKEIKEYCELNNINDVQGFITQCILKGFNIFRYGLSPSDNIKRQNGDIIDNGSNRTNKKEKTITNSMGGKIENKQETETTNIKSVVVRNKRRIKITNID